MIADSASCGGTTGGGRCEDRLSHQDLRPDLSYFPSSEFGLPQWRELSVFVAGATLLVISCRWFVRPRVV
jgi:hypothetical protein